MTAKKKRPEFELPAVLIQAVQSYLGTATVNKLTSTQAHNIARLCSQCAGVIGAVLEDGDREIHLLGVDVDDGKDLSA